MDKLISSQGPKTLYIGSYRYGFQLGSERENVLGCQFNTERCKMYLSSDVGASKHRSPELLDHEFV